MLTIPTALWPYLLSQHIDIVEVYEIEAFGGRSTLYFSSQDVTWGGHSYTGLAYYRDRIKQQRDFKVPDCSVTFSNVAMTLMPYLFPVDTLTGARMTVRLLVKDSAGTPLADSVILFRGVIEPQKRISEGEFPLSATGLLNGGTVVLPGRSMAVTCPWQYANSGAFDGAGSCAYQSNTTANGSGASSTALTLAIASSFANGDIIQIGSGAAVAITSGGGTVNITLSESRTWSSGATIRYPDCPRSSAACSKRGMLYRFGGFPATAGTARLGRKVLISSIFESFVPNGVLPSRYVTVVRPSRSEGQFADPTAAVPVLYGRRRVAPKIIEQLAIPWTNGLINGTLYVRFFAWSEGEVDANGGALAYYEGDVRGSDDIAWDVKTFGIYYRVGTVGVNDFETEPEYLGSPTPQNRSQNIDYLSFGAVSYSELAYVIYRCTEFDTGATVTVPMIEIDGKGVTLRSFDAAGTPASPAWSNSPIWQFVDFATSQKYGLGLLSSDFEFATTKDAADYAAELITSTEAATAVTVSQGTATTKCIVGSTEGFISGRRVDVNAVANEVSSVVSGVEMQLVTAVTQTAGQTVVQRPSRFECHLYLERRESSMYWLSQFLLSCLGYVTYDSGRIQLRIERASCHDQVTNGLFSVWTNPSSAPDGWTSSDLFGEETITRDATTFNSGPYSCKLTRSGATHYAGIQFALTGLIPGLWYRIEYWHKQSALGIGSANRCFLNNDTKGLGCGSDGLTWGATSNLISAEGSAAWTRYEATFKIREDFAASDAYTLRFSPYFTSGNSVWFDDVSFRGPYGGDFRETTTALNTGWKEGSFELSLNMKDSSTNRVALRFINESFAFGKDEIAVNDFLHQQTHQINTLDIESQSIVDRDQAHRVAHFHLNKKRELGHGCEFLGSPAALALQPGDIILVSSAMAGWTCKEQRVIETEILGPGSADENFVVVRTEDYSEALYSDVGPMPTSIPAPAIPDISVTVVRNWGGILELSWVLSDALRTAREFRVYSSATSGFVPTYRDLIWPPVTGTFFRFVPTPFGLDVLRYYRVVATTATGPVSSAEFATTIYSADQPPVDPYSNNFKFPTAVATPSGWGAFSPATVGNVNDASDATYNQGVATMTGGIFNADGDGIDYYTMGNGTDTGQTGRPYVRASMTQTTTTANALVFAYLQYTLDRTAGTPTWVTFQNLKSSAITNYFGPELTGVDFSKFAIRSIVTFPYPSVGNQTATVRNYAVAFDKKA